jgi:Fe2+ transport system protein FeoA
MTLFGYKIEHRPFAGRQKKLFATSDTVATLIDIRPGRQAQLRGFAPGLSSERFAHLQAYGLVPGRWVRVLQHAPVTIIQVENCELALEADLARQIEITASE